MTKQSIPWSRELAGKAIHLSEAMVERKRGQKWKYVVVCSTCGLIAEDLPYTDAMGFHANELAQSHDRRHNNTKPPIVGRSWI